MCKPIKVQAEKGAIFAETDGMAWLSRMNIYRSQLSIKVGP
jgi:hypothetical protein